MRPEGGDGVVYKRPQGSDHRGERYRATLEAPRRTDAEERPHPETEIERAGMHEQSFEDVLVAAHVCSPEATRLPLLAHELQHALEVLSDESATLQKAVAELYERIAKVRQGVGNFETEAALRV